MYPVFINRITKIYPRGLNKVFGSKFRVGYRVRLKISEKSRRTNRLKRCEHNNKSDDSSPSTLIEK